MGGAVCMDEAKCMLYVTVTVTVSVSVSILDVCLLAALSLPKVEAVVHGWMGV